jgi:hypothetical protein
MSTKNVVESDTSSDLNELWEDLTILVGHNDPYVVATSNRCLNFRQGENEEH